MERFLTFIHWPWFPPWPWYVRARYLDGLYRERQEMIENYWRQSSEIVSLHADIAVLERKVEQMKERNKRLTTQVKNLKARGTHSV
jgi:predicted nuclease with TOPRIM domain